jgi:hypothetical protein
MMKRFDRMHIQNTGDRFRFQTIQSRWAAFTELWERQLNARETGRRPGWGRPGAPPAPPPRPPAAAGPGRQLPRDEVVAVASISDPGTQGDRVQQLYEQLSRARREIGEKPIEYSRFAELVQAQVKKLGGAGREVAFSVAMKEGKVTLTAKREGES